MYQTGHKLCQYFTFHGTPNYSQIGILAMQIYHLAILIFAAPKIFLFFAFFQQPILINVLHSTIFDTIKVSTIFMRKKINVILRIFLNIPPKILLKIVDVVVASLIC
jgi:hypothetical protein